MRMRRYGLAAAGVVGATVLLTATPAFAQDTGAPAPDLSIPINLLWVVIGAVLVIFMQAGFALVETGSAEPSTRRTS